jgi:hypothetical protein
MQNIISKFNANTITCINKKVWSALVIAARNTPAGEETFNYFSKCIGTSFKTYLSGKYSERSDVRLVAKLLNVTPQTAARWDRLKSSKPVFQSCTLSAVRAVLCRNVQPETAPVQTIPESKPESKPMSTITLKTISREGISADLAHDMKRLQELTSALEKLTAEIEDKKRAKQAQARELINQIASEAGLIATVNAF